MANRNRIVEIEGIDFCVSDMDYDYYWKSKRCGEESEPYLIACRRLLGLGPRDHTLDRFHVKYHAWGQLDDATIEKLQNSQTVKYIEKWILKESKVREDVQSSMEKIKMLDSKLDPEFEAELEL